MKEADSVHSTLESNFNPPIFSPQDYVARMRQVRSSQPYNVRVVDYTFFQNFENQVSNLNSLRPGRKVGDPCVMNIRKLLYKPNGEIQYKVDIEDNYRPLPQRRKVKNTPFKGLSNLYNGPIKIKRSKYDDLQLLRAVIEKDHHCFYDNLPFE